MFGYRHIMRAPVRHCLLPAGEKRKKVSLPVSLHVSSSSLAKGACDKTQTSHVAVIVTCIRSCNLPFLSPRVVFDLAQIFTDTSILALVSRWDRLLVFGACNAASLACFVLCFALFPILWPVPRKFAILFVTLSIYFCKEKTRFHATFPHTPSFSKARRMRLPSRERQPIKLFVSTACFMFQTMTLHFFLNTRSCS